MNYECHQAGKCPDFGTPGGRVVTFDTAAPSRFQSFQDSNGWPLSCLSEGMLHYYMHDGPAAFRFELAGTLNHVEAAKLEQDWLTASSTIGDRKLIVDLSFVTGIDEAGRALLRRWYQIGAQFAATSPQSHKLVEAITGRPFIEQQSQEPTHEPWSSRVLRSVPVKFSAILVPALAMLLMPSTAWSADDGASMAFARYISTTMQEKHAAIGSEDTLLEIEAALPKLGKIGRMEVVRHTSPGSEPQYSVISFDGDTTVKNQVIARYLSVEQQSYSVTASSVAITPHNYQFRYTGSIEKSGERVYVFSIKPRHRKDGLIEGQIWIDGATGAVVHQEGRLTKRPSVFIRQVKLVRDSGSRAEIPYIRVTRVGIETRLVGRAELTIRERPAALILNAGDQQ